MTEIEIKLLLDETGAARLREALAPPLAEFDQRNEYFDDEDRSLGRSGWGLRLREEVEGSVTRRLMTLKHAGREVGAFTHRPEYERVISAGELDRFRRTPAELLGAARALIADSDFGRDLEIRCVGVMKNRRTIYELPGASGHRIELDRTTWPDASVSHELEAEVGCADDAAPVQAALRAQLDALAIEWRPSPISKLARLMRMLDRA